MSRGRASESLSDQYPGGLQVAEAPLACQPADAKPAALAGEGRSSAASGKPARFGGTARKARTGQKANRQAEECFWGAKYPSLTRESRP